MQPAPNDASSAGQGMSGSIKAIAVIALLLLALLAVGVVFDVVPMDDVTPLVGKVAALSVILAAVAVAVGVLMRSKRS
jgi:hypothetical protein